MIFKSDTEDIIRDVRSNTYEFHMIFNSHNENIFQDVTKLFHRLSTNT